LKKQERPCFVESAAVANCSITERRVIRPTIDG
jgi:hypothetical protein